MGLTTNYHLHTVSVFFQSLLTLSIKDLLFVILGGSSPPALVVVIGTLIERILLSWILCVMLFAAQLAFQKVS